MLLVVSLWFYIVSSFASGLSIVPNIYIYLRSCLEALIHRRPILMSFLCSPTVLWMHRAAFTDGKYGVPCVGDRGPWCCFRKAFDPTFISTLRWNGSDASLYMKFWELSWWPYNESSQCLYLCVLPWNFFLPWCHNWLPHIL